MDTRIERIEENISRVIVGNQEIIELLITTLLAEGHILLDDVPGMGKTKLANTLARSLNADFKRIQFTPDLQPADITGIYYYNQKLGEFTFRPGPLLANIILADEINRAVPRTQSSLLEAMEERQVTIEGEVYELEEPFMVIATQNPIELEGTFPLPEAQLDRFLFKVSIGYPESAEEVEIMKRFQKKDPLQELEPIVKREEILSLRAQVKNIIIAEELLYYIDSLCKATRNDERIKLGLSPRAALSLMKASQAYALIQGREYVLPDDIKYLFPYIAGHRLILAYDLEFTGIKQSEIIDTILEDVAVPVEGASGE
jgi:MoxR-like ATPase